MSPVNVLLSPMIAQISPAATDFDFFAVVGVHLQHAADALAVIFRRIQNVCARRQNARIDTDVGQFANVRVSLDLEGQRRERLVVVGMPLNFLVGAQD